ncbi:MAG: 2,3-bisphosphoglycerate-independent phosphoglycerate mutase [Desulfurococcales archaeon]|nr:2,3-bisphosphoglycerate-independent phosphoglycerate mutase [Desulfurococcales archaeon]
MVRKLAYIVLDGAPDGINAPRRVLSEAYKPNIDHLVSRSYCGIVYTVEKGVAPESDAATMSLLGYDPHKYYTGRGPLEALGAGLTLENKYEVALRANFATINPRTLEITDRRVGRNLSSKEAHELAKSVDGLKLVDGAGYARFKATIGHRGVLIVGHKKSKLSAMITNTDPAYGRKGLISIALKKFEAKLKLAEPMDDSSEAVLAAKLVNEFTLKAIELLDNHPVNKARVSRGLLPANAILSRDAGDQVPPMPPIGELTRLKWGAIVEMPVERGIARAASIGVIPVEVEGKNKKDLLKEEAELLTSNLEEYDAIYVHLKGPDEPGHDGDFYAKKKAVEMIDQYFFAEVKDYLLERNVSVIITSDHSTPWYLKAHSDDPVPLSILVPGKTGDGLRKLDEIECSKGSIGILEGGYNIIPTALELL